MDFSRIGRWEAIGAGAGIVLALSLFFLTWYQLDPNPQREVGNPDAFVCGVGDYDCTGWETFPILRWLLLAGSAAPLILAYILVRSHRLSWAPGEMTMVVGFAMMVLIGYNGILDRPGSSTAEIGVGLELGYWIAFLASVVIAVAGFTRAVESGPRRTRKAPGTV